MARSSKHDYYICGTLRTAVTPEPMIDKSNCEIGDDRITETPRLTTSPRSDRLCSEIRNLPDVIFVASYATPNNNLGSVGQATRVEIGTEIYIRRKYVCQHWKYPMLEERERSSNTHWC